MDGTGDTGVDRTGVRDGSVGGAGDVGDIHGVDGPEERDCTAPTTTDEWLAGTSADPCREHTTQKTPKAGRKREQGGKYNGVKRRKTKKSSTRRACGLSGLPNDPIVISLDPGRANIFYAVRMTDGCVFKLTRSEYYHLSGVNHREFALAKLGERLERYHPQLSREDDLPLLFNVQLVECQIFPHTIRHPIISLGSCTNQAHDLRNYPRLRVESSSPGKEPCRKSTGQNPTCLYDNKANLSTDIRYLRPNMDGLDRKQVHVDSTQHPLLSWALDHKLKTIGLTWLGGISGSLAYNWTRPIPTSLKLIHSRVYAQVRHHSVAKRCADYITLRLDSRPSHSGNSPYLPIPCCRLFRLSLSVPWVRWPRLKCTRKALTNNLIMLRSRSEVILKSTVACFTHGNTTIRARVY